MQATHTPKRGRGKGRLLFLAPLLLLLLAATLTAHATRSYCSCSLTAHALTTLPNFNYDYYSHVAMNCHCHYCYWTIFLGLTPSWDKPPVAQRAQTLQAVAFRVPWHGQGVVPLRRRSLPGWITQGNRTVVTRVCLTCTTKDFPTDVTVRCHDRRLGFHGHADLSASVSPQHLPGDKTPDSTCALSSLFQGFEPALQCQGQGYTIQASLLRPKPNRAPGHEVPVWAELGVALRAFVEVGPWGALHCKNSLRQVGRGFRIGPFQLLLRLTLLGCSELGADASRRAFTSRHHVSFWHPPKFFSACNGPNPQEE